MPLSSSDESSIFVLGSKNSVSFSFKNKLNVVGEFCVIAQQIQLLFDLYFQF